MQLLGAMTTTLPVLAWTRPPSAAASLREGLTETLTVLRLGVPPTLARTGAPTQCGPELAEEAVAECGSVSVASVAATLVVGFGVG